MECGKAPSGVRKVKKKQVKDELDRIKQAEKKKRRLEKALAASAAIISELEKKKEEKQRLDQECAAIAEAVALQVLINEEPDTPCVQAMMQKDDKLYPWGCCARRFDARARTTAAFIPHPHQLADGYGGSRCQRNGYESSDVQAPYVVERDWEGVEVSEAALIAAEAIASLQIADALMINKMLRG